MQFLCFEYCSWFYGLRSYFMCFCKLGILNLDNITTAKGKPGETGTFAASFFQLLLLHDRSGKDSTRLHSCNCHASISLEKAGMLNKWSAFTLQTLGKLFQSLFRQTYPLALNLHFEKKLKAECRFSTGNFWFQASCGM